MTRTTLGNYIVRPEEIYTVVGSITILKDNTRIPSKEVLRVLMDCPGCGKPIVDKRQVSFARQTGLCNQCVTGNCLDMTHRWAGRTMPNDQIPAAKNLLLKILGERVEFNTQPWYGTYDYTELHWAYWPGDGFVRVGYDVFRLLTSLTREEMEQSFRVAIYGSMQELIALTRPRWKEAREKVRDLRNKHCLPR